MKRDNHRGLNTGASTAELFYHMMPLIWNYGLVREQDEPDEAIRTEANLRIYDSFAHSVDAARAWRATVRVTGGDKLLATFHDGSSIEMGRNGSTVDNPRSAREQARSIA